MSDGMAFGDWLFESDLYQATHLRLSHIVQFTRAERALLGVFIDNGGRVLSRDRLLNNVASLAADISDRSIDFIIHRLRRKLRDDSRNPQYIATQYGEGYIWIAHKRSHALSNDQAFLCIGPLRGLEFLNGFNAQAHHFTRALAQEIQGGISETNRVVIGVDAPSSSRKSNETAAFSLSLDFVQSQTGNIDCILALRDKEQGRWIYTKRVGLSSPSSGTGTRPNTVKVAARDIIDALWQASQPRSDEAVAPDTSLLSITLHEASERLHGKGLTWLDACERLERILEKSPNNAEAQLMLAAALHARHVLTPPTVPIDRKTCHRDECRIESLVQQALPQLGTDSIFSLTAAKLLYFVNKAHRSLALGLVEKAMASTTAVANAFAVAGQLQMWEGNIDAAIALYAQGLKLTHHGSHFHRYLLVLTMHAELACGANHSDAADELFFIVPDERALLSLLWAPELTTAVRAEIDAFIKPMNTRAARAIIQRQHYMVARHFRYRTHRQAIMGRPVALLRRYFSKAIIPHDVMADLPSHFICS